MTDHLDREIQGLMVRVMDMAPEPPPFPQAPASPKPVSGVGRSGWKIAFAAGWVLIVLVALPILWLNRDAGPGTPSQTGPEPTQPSPTTNTATPTTIPPTTRSIPTLDLELLTVSAVEASSSLGADWQATNLIDGDLETDWQDASLRGDGAWLLFRFTEPLFLDHMLIYNLPSLGRFTQNHRIRSLQVLVDDEPTVSWQLPDTNVAPHEVPLGVNVNESIEIRVISTYESEPIDDGVPFTELVVAEVEFYGHEITASSRRPSTTLPGLETCSTTDLDLELEPQPDLPAPVAATRQAIFNAAMACDYDTLQALADAGDEGFTASFGGGGVDYYAELEARGSPALADMARHLNQPYAAVPYEDTVYYTWPSAFELLDSPYDDGLPAADYQKLLELYTVADLEEMFNGLGGYVGWRHGILENGEWWFFVAGD